MTQPQPSNLFFVGAIYHRREDWQNFVSEPVATRSSKPDSVAKEIARKCEEQENKAASLCTAGYVTDLTVLDRNGVPILAVTAEGAAPDQRAMPARTFIAYVLEHPESGPFLGPITGNDVGVKWFGFGIRETFSLLAMEALRSGIHVPPSLWLYRPFVPAPVVDPYEILIPYAQRSDIGLPELCRFLSLPIPLPGKWNVDSAFRAELARQLAFRACLAG